MAWLAQLVERGRQHHGERTAVVDGRRHVTYADLDRRSGALAAALHGRGVRRGDRVVVAAHNRLEVVETYVALARVGATAVPVHYGSTSDEVAGVADSCAASLLVGEADLVAGPAERTGLPVAAFDDGWERAATGGAPPPPVDVADDELMFVLHTSATTGMPKGVCVDHRSLHAVATGYVADVRPDPDVVLLHCGPLSHGAVVIPLSYMAAGATVVLMPMFSPLDCLATIARERVTHLSVVPEMLRFLLREHDRVPGSTASLREIVYAAAPMPRPLLLDAHTVLGCGFRQIYGITECGGPVVTLAPEEHDYTPGPASGPAASVGRAIMGAVVGAPGGSAPDGAGELWVRGPTTMRGYWRDPEATAEAVRDGWVPP